jgi:hypothetical protein
MATSPHSAPTPEPATQPAGPPFYVTYSPQLSRDNETCNYTSLDRAAPTEGRFFIAVRPYWYAQGLALCSLRWRAGVR